MWQIWPGQLYPASAVQEAEFREALDAAASRVGRFTRDDVTALMTLLRCGAALEEALTFAPGLRRRLPALLGAYRKMETLRSQSANSWSAICATPTESVWRKEQRSAAILLPVALERVSSESGDGTRSLERAVAHARMRMEQIDEMVAGVESRLAGLPPTFPQASALASALYAPAAPCLYADPFFLPSRVAVLSPARVGDLLGEPRR